MPRVRSRPRSSKRCPDGRGTCSRLRRRSTSTPVFRSTTLKDANLRVSEIAFAHELLRAQRKTIGRLDGRFAGPRWIRCRNMPIMIRRQPRSAQPSRRRSSITYHGDLKFGQGSTYRAVNFGIGDQVEMDTQADRRGDRSSRSSTRRSISRRHWCRMPTCACWCMNGYYDLATPFLPPRVRHDASRCPARNRLAYPDEVLRSRSHMYVHPPSLKKDEGRCGCVHQFDGAS